MTIITRRSLITGLVSLVAAAPAIVRASSLMPVRQQWRAPVIEELDNWYWSREAVHDRMFQRACQNYLERMRMRDQKLDITTIRAYWETNVHVWEPEQ